MVAARGLVRTCFGLDDDRRAEGRGWVRLWRQRGGRGGRADPDEGGWTGGLRPRNGASGGMEVHRERGEPRSGGSDGEGSLGVQREVMGGEVLQLTRSGWGGGYCCTAAAHLSWEKTQGCRRSAESGPSRMRRTPGTAAHWVETGPSPGDLS